MSRTLTISDELYKRLDAEARQRGLQTIEQLLEQIETPEQGLASRDKVVREIDAIRGRLLAGNGEMADSVELLRQDRAR